MEAHSQPPLLLGVVGVLAGGLLQQQMEVLGFECNKLLKLFYIVHVSGAMGFGNHVNSLFRPVATSKLVLKRQLSPGKRLIICGLECLFKTLKTTLKKPCFGVAYIFGVHRVLTGICRKQQCRKKNTCSNREIGAIVLP